jgi:hypothetical protein
MRQLRELATPFPPSLVHKAPQGKYGSYVEHSTYTERLLSIVGPYSTEVREILRVRTAPSRECCWRSPSPSTAAP